METTAINQYFILTQSIITIAAIIIGGIWTYFKFINRREAHPKIIFEVDVRTIGKIGDNWIIELMAILENKGLVRHRIDASTFTFNIRYLTEKDEIKNEHIPQTGNKTYQVNFKNELKLRKDEKENKWLADDWNYTFVEPNTIQKYSHVISVNNEIKFLLVHSRFKYADKKLDFHSAEKVIEIKKEEK